MGASNYSDFIRKNSLSQISGNFTESVFPSRYLSPLDNNILWYIARYSKKTIARLLTEEDEDLVLADIDFLTKDLALDREIVRSLFNGLRAALSLPSITEGCAVYDEPEDVKCDQFEGFLIRETVVALENRPSGVLVCDYNGVFYMLTDKTAHVVRYEKPQKDSPVVLPDLVVYNSNEYPVTSIEDGVFDSCFKLKSIRLPVYLWTIGARAFFHCYTLEYVDCDSAYLEKIGDYAFYWCYRLKSIRLPNCLEKIGEGAFAFTPCSVEVDAKGKFRSEGGALYDCRMEELIHLPSSVNSYVMPNTVKKLSRFALKSSPCIVTPNSNFVWNGGALYSKDRKKLIHVSSAVRNMEVPEGVQEIEEHAFHSCSVERVSIPDSVRKIGDNAFWCCGRLYDVKLPNYLDRISKGMFVRCSSLSKIILPLSVEVIDDYAFYKTSLRSVNITKSVKRIGIKAFDETLVSHHIHSNTRGVVIINGVSHSIQ